MRLIRIRSTTLLAWSPMMLGIAYVVISIALESAFPSLYCETINPGGKELVCGYEHSAGIVHGASFLFWLIYAYLIVLAVARMLHRELSKAGVLGFFLNVAFVVLVVLVFSRFGVMDSP